MHLFSNAFICTDTSRFSKPASLNPMHSNLDSVMCCLTHDPAKAIFEDDCQLLGFLNCVFVATMQCCLLMPYNETANSLDSSLSMCGYNALLHAHAMQEGCQLLGFLD